MSRHTITINGERIETFDHEGFPTNRDDTMTMMTDDNDELIVLGEDGPEQDWFERDDMPEAIATVQPDEEWTETAGGFAKIDIDLDQDVVRGLVDVWARENLEAPSLEVFEEKKAQTDPADAPMAALYDAVVNDIIIQALTEQIARAEAANDTKDV